MVVRFQPTHAILNNLVEMFYFYFSVHSQPPYDNFAYLENTINYITIHKGIRMHRIHILKKTGETISY